MTVKGRLKKTAAPASPPGAAVFSGCMVGKLLSVTYPSLASECGPPPDRTSVTAHWKIDILGRVVVRWFDESNSKVRPNSNRTRTRTLTWIKSFLVIKKT